MNIINHPVFNYEPDYKEKYSKYKSKYLESKKYIGLGGNLVEFTNDYNCNNSYNNTSTQFVKETFNDYDFIKAVAYFNSSKIKGIVMFEELSNGLVSVNVNLEGFEPNTTHGFHVHETGDLTQGCDSLCAHFNPFNKNHGDRTDIERHVGDLGNITANPTGKINIQFTDHLIKLRGNLANIIGRGLIIHADPDDCGKTSHELSKTTGNSGKRIACAIIGYASKCKK